MSLKNMKLAIFMCFLAIGSTGAQIVGPGAPSTCANTPCDDGTCVMVETTPGEPLVPRCVPTCSNPCANVACGQSEQCVLVEVICVQGPCNPVPECRPQELTDVIPFQLRTKRQIEVTCPTECTTPGGCAMVRPLNCFDPNADGTCPIRAACVKANPCNAMRCMEGSQCVITEVFCGRRQCDPIAECEPILDPIDLRCVNEKNQVWTDCGAENQRVCGQTEPNPCSPACQAGCVCMKGFCRNKLGKCVAENNEPIFS
ncbi:hypothetical protein L5515_009800 [Caenorhabditis briggsae]|uniref:TIL domain-containing protein n=1 Tax=Caenorhabditis briggsae TaxID=6238 RepID=A0AAE9JNI4_CAEBR|nr:hypothetical protein L5515_009800 [Caenorhabditis briggsae]